MIGAPTAPASRDADERVWLMLAMAHVSAVGAAIGAVEGRTEPTKADHDAAFEGLVRLDKGDLERTERLAHQHAKVLDDALVIGMGLGYLRSAR